MRHNARAVSCKTRSLHEGSLPGIVTWLTQTRSHNNSTVDDPAWRIIFYQQTHRSSSMAYLSKAQVAQFEEQGYLAVDDLFDPQKDLEPIIEEYKGVLDRLDDERPSPPDTDLRHRVAREPYARR